VCDAFECFCFFVQFYFCVVLEVLFDVKVDEVLFEDFWVFGDVVDVFFGVCCCDLVVELF